MNIEDACNKIETCNFSPITIIPSIKEYQKIQEILSNSCVTIFSCSDVFKIQTKIDRKYQNWQTLINGVAN